MSDFVDRYLEETVEIVRALDRERIETLAAGLGRVRDGGGRLFILGVGGSAGHAGHAVNDFRKICAFEAYAPTDNVSELTARINDDGWDTAFAAWLAGSRLTADDAVLVFSVGGGNKQNNVSVNLIRALDYARDQGAATFAVIGSPDGYAATAADVCVVIPPMVAERRTPHTEGLAAVVWHLLVSHPALKVAETKWESIK